MTKQRIRFLLPVLLAACALLFAGIFVGSVAQAETVWSEVSFQEQYYAGTDLTIPARTVTVNGQTLNASSVLTFPDGSARRVSGRVTLEETGDYTLTYSAAASGASYADKIPFKVISRAFNVSSDYSSVEYTDVSVEFFANGGNVQFDREGLLVNLAQGDVFTSEQLIDVSQLTKNDVLIGLSVIPHTMGEADFTRLEFTLTDALDESVCLRISVTNTTFEDGGGINKNGATVIPFAYDSLRVFHEGLAAAEQGGKWGVIDTANRVVVPFQYDTLSGYNEGLCVAVQNGRAFCIDRYGNEVPGSDSVDTSIYFPEGTDSLAVFTPERIETLRQMLEEGVRQEIAWGHYVIGDDIPGLTKDMITDYIKYLGNQRWSGLGYGTLYEGYDREPEIMTWVSQYSNANMVKTDFFEAKSTAYAKSTALVDDL